MKYRKMGSLDWEVSALGFGCMRFPMKKEGDSEVIDEAEAIKMVRFGIDQGINYIDTAWPYHGGQSEILVGKALKDGYREKIKLVSKSPVWLIEKSEDFDDYLDKQLKKLDTPYLDIYLLHALGKQSFEKVKTLKLVERMEKAKENGLIKHIGFSFHDDFEVFKEIIDFYPWEMAQIQFNYVDQDSQATLEGLRYASEKGIAVVIMEPIKGGALVKTTPEISELLVNSPIKRTLADWALQYVWNFPEVATLLSGMSSMEQVQENIESAINSGINKLSDKELQLITKLAPRFKQKSLVPCTFCKYCLPCPSGVAIPTTFRILNDYFWDGLKDTAYKAYTELCKEKDNLLQDPDNGDASLCVQCGQCLDKCPQAIDIPTNLEKVHAVLTGTKEISEVFNLQVRGPTFIEKPSFEVVGMTITGEMGKMNILGLWEEFNKQDWKIKHPKTGSSWGISFPIQDSPEQEYLACSEVSKVEDIPDNMIVRKIPGQKWAKFTHIGPIAKFEDTMNYIYGEWLKENGKYTIITSLPILEYYDGRFSPTSQNSEFDVYIPIL